MLEIEKIEVDVANAGHITNCYLVFDETKKAILIDPGYDAYRILSKLKEKKVTLQYILLTHGHADHMGALKEIEEATRVPILISPKEKDMVLEKIENYAAYLGVERQNISEDCLQTVQDEESVLIGNHVGKILYTPGHSAGSICLFFEKEQILFTGDTVFSDCYGRCDLLGGSKEEMILSLRKVFKLGEEIKIFPGHGEITTLKKAKKYIKMLFALKGITL